MLLIPAQSVTALTQLAFYTMPVFFTIEQVAANPDRALALLFVAPHDGLAIDVLTAN